LGSLILEADARRAPASFLRPFFLSDERRYLNQTPKQRQTLSAHDFDLEQFPF